jgi:hypothetical protein
MSKKKHSGSADLKIQSRDLQDLIRDEIYGAAEGEGVSVICIPMEKVKKIARKIAARVFIGH